jgi:hypothetical protein
VLHRSTGIRLNDVEWFCTPACLEEALQESLRECFMHDDLSEPIRTHMPLGLMMLARGVISDAELRSALKMQHQTGERIGACLLRMGCISAEDIASVVATQWGCPVFPQDSVHPACSMLLPYSLAERYRMIPVHLVPLGRRLFVGFCEKVNHSALIATEKILGCATEACVIPEPKFKHILDSRKLDTTGEVTVLRPRSAVESAKIIRNYAQQTAAESLRLQAIGGNIWARFFVRGTHLDLIFEQLTL